jgi:hypothetical protein
MTHSTNLLAEAGQLLEQRLAELSLRSAERQPVEDRDDLQAVLAEPPMVTLAPGNAAAALTPIRSLKLIGQQPGISVSDIAKFDGNRA